MGDPEAKVNNFATIEEGKPGCISFLANEKYEQYIYGTESSVVLVNENFEPKQEIKATLIKVANAREAVAKLLQIYESMKPKREGISDLAFIDPSAKIGEKCYIGPFVAIAEGRCEHRDLQQRRCLSRLSSRQPLYSSCWLRDWRRWLWL